MAISGDESVWPSVDHDLTKPPAGYYGYSDLAWQRQHGDHGRITGYRRGAELMFEALSASTSIADLDTVIFPFAMSWRHHIELYLKSLIPDLSELLERPARTYGHHRIKDIWRDVEAMIREIWPDDTKGVDDVARVVGQFADMDPDGQGFRYHVDRKGKLNLGAVDHIDLRTFHESLRAVSNFLGAVADHADNDVTLQREMYSEFRPY